MYFSCILFRFDLIEHIICQTYITKNSQKQKDDANVGSLLELFPGKSVEKLMEEIEKGDADCCQDIRDTKDPAKAFMWEMTDHTSVTYVSDLIKEEGPKVGEMNFLPAQVNEMAV